MPHDKIRLRALARLCGIAVSYLNFEGKAVTVPDATLIALVNVLQDEGSLPEDPSGPELDYLYQKIKAARRDRILPRTVIAWDKRLDGLWVWASPDQTNMLVTLKLENGDSHTKTVFFEPDNFVMRRGRKRARIGWPDSIPYGYHRLIVDDHEALLISTPRKVKDDNRDWGFFAPSYALRSQQDQGIGGYRELREAAFFVGEQGGAFFGTLPLLATRYDENNSEVSPYAPSSRLFWNEIFLDVRAPDGNEVSTHRAYDIVDYEKIYRLKKPLLQQEAHEFFAQGEDKSEEFQEFLRTTPYLKDYAAFRAGRVPDDQREKEEMFHLYVQFACHRQLLEIRKNNESGRYAGLYLDYPVGIQSDGFDASYFSSLFLRGFDVGAPPDMFYDKGQNWGFRPYCPRALEDDRFAYFRATLHAHLRYARMLRLDHVMGFRRIFCIPHGRAPGEGAYIYYPFDEFLAVMCLEAHRHKTVLVGEDLGTVPDYVRQKMADHNINRMWIFQFEIRPDQKETFSSLLPGMIAALNTHDLFPFEAFLNGEDMDELQAQNLIEEERAKKIRVEREEILKSWHKKDLLQFVLKKMAVSPARHVMVNIEDVWRETNPQNIPGITDGYPNWRRRLAVPVEEWRRHNGIKAIIASLNEYRGNRHA